MTFSWDEAARRLRAVRPHAFEALQPMLGRYVGRLGRERLVGRVADHELQAEPFRVVEGEAAVLAIGFDPLAGQPFGPEAERLVLLVNHRKIRAGEK